MPIPAKVGRDPQTERDLYLLNLESFADPITVNAAANFVCFVVADARMIANEVIARFMESLLRAGASYICTWGPDCERVHDIADGAQSDPDLKLVPDEAVVMTTWHKDDSLDEALEFFLNTTVPDEYYVESTKSGLCIVIANTIWSRAIGRVLADPDDFRRKLK